MTVEAVKIRVVLKIPLCGECPVLPSSRRAYANPKLITGVASRAGAIVDEARHGGSRTIVIGRRGISKVEEVDSTGYKCFEEGGE